MAENGDILPLEGLKNEVKVGNDRMNHNHIYDLLTSEEVSWQAIIYDLINSEQLDPWDVDIVLLSNKYLVKIRELEEANFFLSSKVLLAASLLLRLKSEFLLNKHLKGIDDILFGKKEGDVKEKEKYEFDSDEVPDLYPRTPLPRFRKVSLQELMQALNTAITTENRRIRKEISRKHQLREAEIVFPRTRVNIKDRIRKIYARIQTSFKKKKDRISYSELIGDSKEEKVASFLPVLHLDHQRKVFLEQEGHFGEIWIWLFEHYDKNVKERIKYDIEEVKEELNAGYSNPLANFSDISSEIMKGNLGLK
ncbi:MAG: segregation/condensation protein A [archaeon]